ncbi:Peptidyl-prolyl cis-trans isomerase E [Psilocybe cubensis]|uniref:Peptidyl-prolyl cis-trans isomerase E n=2 Tax=Psilocybe cubensis TaxID=181762 RepID=A0ACB8GUM6_PSICU|nr:Peptidyl-prolyl cis-trans isomerase E [Psilocybe cubensis]KAH9478714.1 Peptidyl-prolyl cis-trans isomerase E [Psilocybe cubensis]
MEEGTKTKKTVFVGGISDDTDETALYESFSTFGDILEVQIPPPANQHQNPAPDAPKHRGFAFVTYTSTADAQDAIDNMDMNELKGRVLKVNLARPMKTAAANLNGNRAIWESEEWLKEHIKPLAQSGGVQGRHAQPIPEESEEKAKSDDGDAMEE